MPQFILTALRVVLPLLLGSFIIAACANSEFTSSSGQKSSEKTKKNGQDKRTDKDDNSKDDGDDNDDDDDLGGDDDKDGEFDPDADLDIVNGGGGDGDILVTEEGLKCDKGKAGLVGKLYRLAPNTPRLPDFKTMTPVGQVESLQLNVPEREWKKGFPGVPDLNEWFAIEFFASLDVPEDGTYNFRTHSDDGSKLYINDKLVVDNDGTHSPTSRSGSTSLKKGKQKLKVEWFQGPRTKIALQVFWKKPSGGEEIIPASVLTRNKDCNLQDLGKFE